MNPVPVRSQTVVVTPPIHAIPVATASAIIIPPLSQSERVRLTADVPIPCAIHSTFSSSLHFTITMANHESNSRPERTHLIIYGGISLLFLVLLLAVTLVPSMTSCDIEQGEQLSHVLTFFLAAFSMKLVQSVDDYGSLKGDQDEPDI